MKVREFLSNKDRWTQGAMARNKYGWSVALDDENATCFCLLGAMKKIEVSTNTYAWLNEKFGRGSFVAFNDCAENHEGVMKRLDELIAEAPDA